MHWVSRSSAATTPTARSSGTPSPTRADSSGGRTRGGYAIQAHYGASAEVDDNHLEGNARGVRAFLNAEIGPD